MYISPCSTCLYFKSSLPTLKCPQCEIWCEKNLSPINEIWKNEKSKDLVNLLFHEKDCPGWKLADEEQVFYNFKVLHFERNDWLEYFRKQNEKQNPRYILVLLIRAVKEILYEDTFESIQSVFNASKNEADDTPLHSYSKISVQELRSIYKIVISNEYYDWKVNFEHLKSFEEYQSQRDEVVNANKDYDHIDQMALTEEFKNVVFDQEEYIKINIKNIPIEHELIRILKLVKDLLEDYSKNKIFLWKNVSEANLKYSEIIWDDLVNAFETLTYNNEYYDWKVNYPLLTSIKEYRAEKDEGYHNWMSTETERDDSDMSDFGDVNDFLTDGFNETELGLD